jgi:hypothetical protein
MCGIASFVSPGDRDQLTAMTRRLSTEARAGIYNSKYAHAGHWEDKRLIVSLDRSYESATLNE